MANSVTPYNKEYNENDEIDLYEVLDVILKRKILIIVITLIGVILSFVCALYYSKNIKKEKYAQDFTVNYVLFNDESLIKNGNFKPLEILSLLNNDDVIDEFFKIEGLKQLYEKNKKTILSDREEFIEKRAFLKNFLSIKPIDAKQIESGLGIKRYTSEVSVKKGSELETHLIKKIIELIDKRLNEEFFAKLDNLDSYNKVVIDKNLQNLSSDRGSLEILSEIKDIRVENVDTVIKYINPSLFANITDSLNRYREAIILDEKIEFLREKLKSNSILEMDTSIYLIEVRGYTKIILLMGCIFSGLLAIGIAFLKEFLENYKRIIREKIILKELC